MAQLIKKQSSDSHGYCLHNMHRFASDTKSWEHTRNGIAIEALLVFEIKNNFLTSQTNFVTPPDTDPLLRRKGQHKSDGTG